MVTDMEKLQKARLVLQKMVDGVNPLTGELIESDHFLQDPRIVRCLLFISDALKRQVDETAYKLHRPEMFTIDNEVISRVELPAGKIGVTEFSRCINQVIDLTQSRKLTGAELNKRLKQLGILSETVNSEGKVVTVINDKSANYGFEMERRIYNEREYDMVLMNDKGKQFLLDNLQTIMAGED